MKKKIEELEKRLYKLEHPILIVGYLKRRALVPCDICQNGKRAWYQREDGKFTCGEHGEKL